MKRQINRCTRCGLPETYPGVKFNAQNICNYCVHYDLFKDREKSYKRALRKELLRIIEKTRKGNKAPYDCVLAYSGGKDSTYLLHFLKNTLGLNVVAHTLDNGFISSTALMNIERTVEMLNVDLRITKPPPTLLKRVFTYALVQQTPYPKEILAMMSPLCTVCQGMVLGTTIKLAMRLRIPLMFVGYTPGQYPAISLENFLKAGSCAYLSKSVFKDDPLDIIKIIRDPLDERFGDKIDPYYFKSQYIGPREQVPIVLFPFHVLLDYDENRILRELRKLGWMRPKDTDPCSTNCMINALGNYMSMQRLRYHPYAGELSFLVRSSGKMDRLTAIEAQNADRHSPAMIYSLKKLGLSDSFLRH